MQINFIENRNTSIAILRDDLFPALGGGNKGRKMALIAEDIKAFGGNALVTTGGIQSNHCRAVALCAAENGWRCKLILHGSKERFFDEGGNAMIIRMTGAEIEFVDADSISGAMGQAMSDLENEGFVPYYIYGGGHNIGGGTAYVKAVEELNEYCKGANWFPDYIFVASGTGSTQAGILAGLDYYGIDSEVVGISIARSKERASEVVEEFYTSLKSSLKINSRDRDVKVFDNYLAGGYESYNQEIINIISEVARDSGILLDPTYTGKAFWGMMEQIQKETLSGNILFWHTGGINNLLSSKLF